MRTTLVLFMLVLPAAAGCVDDAFVEDVEQASAVPTLEPTTLDWRGYIRAGGAKEVPRHVAEVQPLFDQAWSTAFELDIAEAPQSLQVEVDWEATAARILLMLKEPKGEGPYVIYETSYADEGPLCVRAPDDALQPGVWTVMAHSEYAVDADLTFTVTLTGSDASIPEDPPAWPLLAFPDLLLESEKPPAVACEAT